jgi:Protein of unknown function (DUF998)
VLEVPIVKKVLLVCGVLSSLLYVAMNVFIPMLFEGYSLASQTVSELSALGAPTRPLWVWLGIAYALLVAAFGWGVWKSAGGNGRLRVVGGLLVADGLIGLFWPPMHLRGAEFTITDAMHIAWSAVTVLLMMFAIGFAAAAFGKRFRAYSIVTMVILILFGVLTGMDGPRIAANLPTPWVGVWERISIAAFILWVVVLAVRLLRGADSAARANRRVRTSGVSGSNEIGKLAGGVDH